LLFTKLQTVADDLGLAVLAVLPGREVAFFYGTLFTEAFRPLEEQLHALAAAQTTYWSFIACQFSSPLIIGLRAWRAGRPDGIFMFQSFKVSKFQ
jgi:hypothetical protein